MYRKAIASLLVAASAVALVACGSSTEVQQVSVTQGQELMDLKKAFDAGTITEKEYNKMREDIIKRYR